MGLTFQEMNELRLGDLFLMANIYCGKDRRGQSATQEDIDRLFGGEKIGRNNQRDTCVKNQTETTGLQAALKDVNQMQETQLPELRQVERLLKFNPHDTELLAQKQQLLAQQG